MTALLIAGNAVLAIFCAVFFIQHAKLKKSSEAEIEELKRKVEEEIKELSITENQMRESLQADSKKIESLLQEVVVAKKEKEDEMKLRMETEKEIALSHQKVDDIQKRMQDWKAAQEAAMKDAQDAIFEVGENLYEKINTDLRNETDNTHNLLERIIESVKNLSAQNNVAANAINTSDSAAQKQQNQSSNAPNTTSDLSKKLVADLMKSMQESNHIAGEKYFTASNFDASVAKLFLCEAAFVQDTHFYIFDFKSCNFFDEYERSANKDAAQKVLTQKLDKYVAYLGNEKYRAAIMKAAESKNINFDGHDIVAIIPTHGDLELLDKIGYLEKIENVGVKLATFDEIIDLTL